ncbi:cupin domain-containing protein [Pontibacter fetidus]|uniref:Phosphoheptose isomerase n=1 Tax=Pontibacter fetidus TaxID=2700082 RepID=A0A6B2H7Y9_9BACT|nr:phosphoheptose isomerase [Pontibacter fetidus]NDK55274.1 phosphoheptose isomerase [Pontibacter fetidus]
MVLEENKTKLFKELAEEIAAKGFIVEKEDQTRPWGGFFVIDENQAQRFADTYFNGISIDDLKISGKLSPKILVVAPDKRLSWQYHHRRAEIWQVIKGTVGVVTSDTDTEGERKVLNEGDLIKLQQGERHRLVGLSDWGVLAEIWQHTDAANPSDEDDIVRVQDDFGR